VNLSVVKLGFYSAWISATAASGYGVSQLLQVAGLVHKPIDEILIYGFSLGIAPPFLLAILALHYTAAKEKKIWSHAAVLFALMYNCFVILMYVVQLSSVIPYQITDPVLIVTPHSLFWTLDALGYICMGAASLLVVPVFSSKGAHKWPKWFFLAHGLMTPIVALVYFYPTFSIPLLLIASPWSITAPGAMICLANFFLRHKKEMRDVS
jgi:hypothetical protein